MQKSLIDAGPLIALFDRDDRYHQQVLTFLKNYRGQLITTWPVITETLHMLDFDVRAQIDFLCWLHAEAITVYPLDKECISRVLELTEKDADRPIDFADATLLVTAEITGIRDIISIDSDFFIYRVQRQHLNNISL